MTYQFLSNRISAIMGQKMRSWESTQKILIRVGFTIDPGDGNGLTAGNEEERDPTGTEGVH